MTLDIPLGLMKRYRDVDAHCETSLSKLIYNFLQRVYYSKWW